MKEGDVCMIFGNPVKQENPIGQAKLCKKISNISSCLEQWEVEYLDQPDHKYIALIKKTNGESE